MSHKVLLVDQADIQTSCDALSLFINGVHIIDDDEHDQVPSQLEGENGLRTVANRLATALGTEVTEASLSEALLAESIAHSRGELSAFRDEKLLDEDYSQWLEAYTNDDVLKAVDYHSIG